MEGTHSYIRLEIFLVLKKVHKQLWIFQWNVLLYSVTYVPYWYWIICGNCNFNYKNKYHSPHGMQNLQTPALNNGSF